MKLITRTLSNFTIIANQIKYVDGIIEVKELPVLITGEKLTDAKLQKHFKSLAEQGSSIVIKETTQVDKLYSISVENFIKYGKEVVAETPKEIAKEVPKEKLAPVEEINKTDSENKVNKQK